MKQCFGYVRVSTAKQGEGVSLAAQKEAIQQFADRQGFQVIRWFEEKETAAKRGRPVFDAMIRDLRRGRAAGVIIHKIDRSARNFADWAKIGDLADAGIDVHFATESLDFRSRGGRLTADIQAVIAADYIRNLREETIKGINGRLKQGLYPFKAPLGYVDNGGGKPKTIDPARGPLVRQAFELYGSGNYSIRSLLAEMTERGLTTPRGKALSHSHFDSVLTNPFYCGLIKIQTSGSVYPGVHEPLIPVSLFETVQDIKTGRHVKKATRHRFTYRGLFRCRQCATSMIPERQKGHVYYRCQKPGCPTTTVREEMIETAVWQTLRETRLSEIDVEHLSRKMTEWLERRSDASRTLTLANQIADRQAKLDRLTDALIDRLIDEETFTSRKERIVLEIARLEEEKAKAAKSAPPPEKVRQFLELIKSLAATYLIAIPEEKREIVEIATSNRVAYARSVYLEPSNWLSETEAAIAALYGPRYRDSSRTGEDDASECLARLIEEYGEATRSVTSSKRALREDNRAPRTLGRGGGFQASCGACEPHRMP